MERLVSASDFDRALRRLASVCIRVLASLSIVHGMPARADGPTIPDSAVIDWLSTDARTTLLIGRYRAVDCAHSDIKAVKETGGYKNACLSNETMRVYENWAKAGLITVVDPDPNTCILSRADPAQCTRLFWVHVIIEPTTIGQKYVDPKSPTQLTIPLAGAQLERIIKKQAFKRGADDYSLVLMTFDVKPSDAQIMFNKAMDRPLDKEKKARVVFKRDPFSEKWQFVTGDFAGRESAFTTNNVDRLIPVDIRPR